MPCQAGGKNGLTASWLWPRSNGSTRRSFEAACFRTASGGDSLSGRRRRRRRRFVSHSNVMRQRWEAGV